MTLKVQSCRNATGSLVFHEQTSISEDFEKTMKGRVETDFGIVLLQADDGNCLFRSLAHGVALELEKSPMVLSVPQKEDFELFLLMPNHAHFLLRKEVVDWMRANYQNNDTLYSYLVGAMDDINELNQERSDLESRIMICKEEIESLTNEMEKSAKLILKNDEERSLMFHHFHMLQKGISHLSKIHAQLEEQLSKLSMPYSADKTEKDFTQYFTAMRQNKTFAGLAEIYAVSQIFGIDIVIRTVDKNHDLTNKEDLIILNESGNSKATIKLEFINGNHYNLILASPSKG